MTIAVCDLADAARIAAGIDPEDLRLAMGEVRRRVASVAEPAGGFVARQADDRVAVFFGYPQAHEDDAERAVRAALAIVDAIAATALPGLSAATPARVAVATGLVVVGESADDADSTEPSAVGETPLLAARLLAAAGPGSVLIAATTRRLIGGLFDCRAIDGAAADSSAVAWRVVREYPSASRFEALRPRHGPLVGRAEELALLARRWRQAKGGEGRAVLIWGEPGIGKSRLVDALQDALRSEPHARLRYFCAPQRTQTALHPVIAQLEGAAGIDADDDAPTKHAKLERLLEPSSDDLALDRALLTELLSIPADARIAPLSLSAPRRRELLLERLVAQLTGLAARQPVLIVLEDAHWIDPTSRELFDALMERIRELPVLLVMTYRPEFVPPWLGQSHVTGLTLARLGRRDNAVLVRHVAGDKALPSGVVDAIVARTDGVPLFIEEVTKSVLESGALREEGDRYVEDRALPTPAVPATLQASLAARLDRLADARELAQLCAALGREFDYGLLHAVAALDDAKLAARVAKLVDSGLVHQRGTLPNATLAFKHALVQDAAYESMTKRQRCDMHRRIAAALVQAFPDVATRHPDVLAHHCAEAQLWDDAIEYRLRAARVALVRSAGVEAHAQVDKGRALLPKIEAPAARQQLEGRLEAAAGDALTMTRGFASPEVVAALTHARALLDARRYPVEALGALCGIFNYHLIRSESPQCLALAEPQMASVQDRPAATVVRYLIGTAHLHLGNFRPSIEHLEAALALYDDGDCRSVAFVAGYHLRSFTLIWLGLGLLYTGAIARSTDVIAAAVADARGRAHPFTLVSALLAQARFCSQTLDFDGAVTATEEGMAIAAAQRSPYHLSRASILRAVNAIDGGRPAEGICLMEQALAAHRATGANFQSAYNLSRLADAHAGAGRPDRAADFAQQALAEVARTGERWWEAEAERTLGRIALHGASPDRAQAERCFRRALACARRQGATLWELGAAHSLAALLRDTDRCAEARALLAPVCGAFEHEGARGPHGPARELLTSLERA